MGGGCGQWSSGKGFLFHSALPFAKDEARSDAEQPLRAACSLTVITCWAVLLYWQIGLQKEHHRWCQFSLL